MKGTKLYSIFKNKCPKCHEGDFFVSKNPYNLKDMAKLHDNCAVCGEKFMPEVGFYYGAMYVSYALGVALFVAVWVATLVLAPNIGAFGLIGLVLGALFILFPVIFRAARLTWINIFVKYRGKEALNTNKK